MNDELTPQEQEALASLPRERMPAGLEERVVGAMRDRGFIAPRRARVVKITNSRVAGLLAASLVLMIGAYSIGLHRGDNRALESVTPAQLQGVTRFEEVDRATPAVTQDRGDLQGSASLPATIAVEKRAKRNLDWKLETNVGEDALKKDTERKPSRGEIRTDMPVAETESATPAESDKRAARELHDVSSPQPPSVMKLSDGVSMGSAAAPASPSEKRFMLNGSALFVSAPDSVRVVQDEQGRVLLIYTSDGIIRIRLADTP